MAIVPISAESVCAAVAVLIGLLPGRGTVAAASAVFPLDVYFDVKQAVASASSWVSFVAVAIIGIAIRSVVLAWTLWLAEGTGWKLPAVWRRVVPTVFATTMMFVPVATAFYAGSVLRYAPFIWAAAPVGFAIALAGTRRAIRLDVGAGAPPPGSTPEGAPYLGYVFVVIFSAAAISFMGERSSLLAALLVASMGPVHALFLLGWREQARMEVYPGGGSFAVAATSVVVALIAVGTFYDRVVRSPGPVARTQKAGSIALLGGADSTSESGALTQLDVRSLGYPTERVHRLSYRQADRYSAADTRTDPDEVATVVADQIRRLVDLEAVVGHSQAALIVDRMLAEGEILPGIVTFAPLPPRPPRTDLPAQTGAVPGPDLARTLSAVLAVFGGGFELDAPSVPARLDPVVVGDPASPRLAIWALGDSVWLDSDWRRPGEVNLVAITDHVGVTRNRRALDAARDFLAGRPVEPDVSSWRGVLVPMVRYAFEPWRTETL